MEWRNKHFSYFCNRECEYFPCHQTENTEDYNCLFCYCPLYALGDRCGGNYQYLADGTKDCSVCLVPHRRENYERILSKYPEIMKLARKEKE